MDYRKLIKFGNSSHIVSLPNSWIKKNKLKKGDLIYFEENGNGELVLNHQLKKEEHFPKEFKINIVGKSVPTIEREIMNAYVNDYEIIIMEGDLKRCRKEIDDVLNNLLALEVMERTPNKLVVKDFLNLKEVSIPDNIRRIDLTIRSIMIDLKESMEKGVDYLDDVSHLDLNVNKVRFLVYRAINKCLKSNNLDFYPNIKSFMELLNYRLIVNNLEDIADECKRVSRFLKTAKLKKNEKNDIKKIFFEIEKNYLEVMKAYYSQDKQLAHDVASKKYSVIEECRNLFKIYDNRNVGVILEKLKGMESFIRNIARVVIDTEK